VEGRRRKRRLWPWLAALAVLGGLLAHNYWPGEPDKIIISPETTYILGPLNADGTVNYVKYLDDKYSQGVTPENNAAPLLLRALGPDMLPDKIRSETLSCLNLPADIFDGDKHFIQWEDRARPGKADASVPGDANAASSSAPAAKGEDESADEPNINDVLEMLQAGQVHPDLEAWLASNASPLELVRQATAKDKFYLPFTSASNPPDLAGVALPSLSGYSHMARALAMRAALKAARNDMPGAWDDVLTAHKLARLQDRSPVLIGRIVGNMADWVAAQAGTAIATRYPIPPALGRELLTRLAAVGPKGNIADVIDEGERFLGLDIVMMLSRVKAGQAAGITDLPVAQRADLDWNQVLRDMNSWYDRMAKPMRLPRFQGRAEAQKAFDDELQAFATQRGRRATPLRVGLLKLGGRLTRQGMTDVISACLVCIVVPSLASACDNEDLTKMTFEIETLAVALACFHAEHGRWPGELKELCPSLLKEIPADRFSASPLVYRPSEKGYLLYSVGKNLRDDGGQCDPRGSAKSAGSKDDIVAGVKPAEATSMPAEAASKPAAS
jgi:hypothetical protein